MKIVSYLSDFAGIEYRGLAGISEFCKSAIIKLVHSGDKIEKALLLSGDNHGTNSHCFLLIMQREYHIAIKSGFSSGYSGEGPRALAYTLKLLDKLQIDIDEYKIHSSIIERIDQSCLTKKDFEDIHSLPPVRPQRWHEYIFDQDKGYSSRRDSLFSNFPQTIPLFIIDDRLIDLALDFEDNPDNAILVGYRRLEDIIRTRTKLEESSTKLFAKTFLDNSPMLTWDNIELAEHKGLSSLFSAT